MPLIQPFAGLRPVPAHAADVAAPPYDVLNTDEARARAAGRPWSFLHISKPEIDLPPGTDPYAPEVYAKAAETLDNMIRAGVLLRDDAPKYYVYRLIMDGHVQTGLVATASVKDYDSNRIRRHEFTRPDKEDDRVRQITALNAQTGPVFLAYPSAAHIDEMLERVAEGEPEYDLTADTGVRHMLWVVNDAGMISDISAAFDGLPALYIADGHHRSASASRIAATRRAADQDATGNEPYNYFLSVIFPHRQLRILDYNRVVKDLNGLSPEALLAGLERDFTVSSSDTPVAPAATGEFGLYLKGGWYRLTLKPGRIPVDDPVACLDVSLLAHYVIEPMFGIVDPRRDKRIDFVGGIRGLDELARRVDSGEMAAAFSLFPTRMEALMAVADAGEVMPPKSTWFEPKLADGLVSHVLD